MFFLCYNIMSVGIHIFRRDLRVIDNYALSELYKVVDRIIPVFILDENQIIKNDKNKHYYSNNAVQFICESLEVLNDELSNKLLLLKGDPVYIIEKLINELDNVTAISFNNDYTLYSMKRDNDIMKQCKKHDIKVIAEDDQFLVEPGGLCKSDGSAYMIFGSFYKNHSKFEVINVSKIRNDKFYKPRTSIGLYDIKKIHKLYDDNSDIAQHGGRVEGLKKLKSQSIHDFKYRDILINKSFNISAYLNMGCISIREMYNYVKHNEEIVKQLVWRDFYNCIMIYHPDGNKCLCLDERFNKIRWPKVNKSEWTSFINCKTGFLMIDAAFKELQVTGYIGNRQRLLLGTFWIKYLLIDPFDKKYGIQSGFSRYLVDCVFSQNVMNIRWLMSELDLPGRRFIKKGCKAISGRVIKIGNDMLKKYDPDHSYVRKWLNLKEYSDKELRSFPTMFDEDERYSEYCHLLR